MARQRRRPIDILTPDDVQTLIAAASNRAPSGIRNRALIAVLYFSGIRLAEALALHAVLRLVDELPLAADVLLEDRLQVHADLRGVLDLDVVLRGEVPHEVVYDGADFS